MIIRYMDVSFLEDKTAFRRFYGELSPQRRAKIDRLSRPDSRRQSLGAGILLDVGLRDYGLREQDVSYALRPGGKPFLPDHPDIYFSLSHAGTVAMAAFAGQEVGCDIEAVRPVAPGLAARFFHPDEQAFLRECGDPERQFIRLWTLKESFAKLTGHGLGQDLRSFCVIPASPSPDSAILFSGDETPPFFTENGTIPGFCAAGCTRTPEEVQWIRIDLP